MKPRERWYSFAVLAGMAAVLLFVCGCSTPGPAPEQEIVIGALLPLTGDYTSAGVASQAALQVAVEDLNAYYQRVGSPKNVRLVILDTKSDPLTAETGLENLTGQGIRVVIGPGSSAELEALKGYSDQKGILLVSTMSTATSLAIAGDSVFRFIPDDTHQAGATAYYLDADGIEAIIPVWRGDVWGDGLLSAVSERLQRENHTILDGMRYEPGTQEFHNIAASLDRQAGEAISRYGANHVGVYAITFAELVPLMNVSSGKPNLSLIKWYGADGNVLIDPLTKDPIAADFAIKTHFVGPTIGYSPDERFSGVYKNISTKLGRQPDAYSYATYDAFQVAAAALGDAGQGNAQLREAFIHAANRYSGIAGLYALDEAGDKEMSVYDFWRFALVNGTPRWKYAGQYTVVSRDSPSGFKE